MTHNIVVVFLFDRAAASAASVTQRLGAGGELELVETKKTQLRLPEDYAVLRGVLAHEIETLGEAEALLRWATRFTEPFTALVLASHRDASRVVQDGLVQELRSEYGEDAVYVSPDAETAHLQRAMLFPAPPTEDVNTDSAVSVTSTTSATTVTSVTTATTVATVTSDTAGSSDTASTRSGGPSCCERGGFKARAVPASVGRPTIEPRLSRAAALRMGVPLPVRSTPSPTKPTLRSGSSGISGVPKRAAAPPASLRTPTIVPRLNKAALARQTPTSSTPGPECRGRDRVQIDFSNTPGHKRHSLATSIASTAPPAIVPRQNRASLSRIHPHPQPSASTRPASATERAKVHVDFSTTPGHKRLSLAARVASTAPPSIVPRQNRASLSRINPATLNEASGQRSMSLEPKRRIDFAATPGHKRNLELHIASLQPPSLAPRHNRTSLARTTAPPQPPNRTS